MGIENYSFKKIDYYRSGTSLVNKIIGYCSSDQLIDSKVWFEDFLHSNISKVTMQLDGKEYYKLIGSINSSLHSEKIKSQDFCDNIRRIIIEQAKSLRPNDNQDYSNLIKNSKSINTKNHLLCEAISLKGKNKSIDEKSIKKIDELVKNAKMTMSNEDFESTLLEAQVLVLSCRNKTVYEKINKILAPYIETEAEYQPPAGSNSQLVQQNAETSRPDKENLPESKEPPPVISEEKMEHGKEGMAKPQSEVVSKKKNSSIKELLIRESKLKQSDSGEKEPEFKKILASHTIEEAINAKVVFNNISSRSLNLIESKIKAKFNELKSSKTPELFEREMFNAQEILKKYDNELVCEKINKIISKYFDKYELYIRENKSPISRIWCAINSVSLLQDITPRKFNEFKMAVIDSLKKEPIEDVKSHSSELMLKISKNTHENIAKTVNDFIESYSIDRINELKEHEKLSVESKPELLEPGKNIDTEELIKEVSLKKIISHVFNRIINNIRRLFSKN